MKIKKIERNEIDQIETLWNELRQHHQDRTIDYTQHYLETTFSKRRAELLVKTQMAIFVAEVDGSSIGFCVVSVNGTHGEIDSLFVKPDQRECHVGISLMNEGMKWLNLKNLESIRLLVGQGNEEVLSFYEKFGFKTRATMMELI